MKFVTGALKNNVMNDDYQGLLDDKQTVVFYMGLNVLEHMVAGLINVGKNPATPIAIIANASLPNQQVLTGTLANIVAKQAAAKLPAPAVIIMGEVVTLHETLAWYGR